MKTVANHTPGKIRYITYILEFPDGDMRTFQTEFIHPLDHELQHTNWYKYSPAVYRDLLQKGEADFRDNNKVRWVIKIENNLRPGTQQLKRKLNV